MIRLSVNCSYLKLDLARAKLSQCCASSFSRLSWRPRRRSTTSIRSQAAAVTAPRFAAASAPSTPRYAVSVRLSTWVPNSPVSRVWGSARRGRDSTPPLVSPRLPGGGPALAAQLSQGGCAGRRRRVALFVDHSCVYVDPPRDPSCRDTSVVRQLVPALSPNTTPPPARPRAIAFSLSFSSSPTHSFPACGEHDAVSVSTEHIHSPLHTALCSAPHTLRSFGGLRPPLASLAVSHTNSTSTRPPPPYIHQQARAQPRGCSVVVA